MSYIQPIGTAANVSWEGSTSYTPPIGTAANVSPQITGNGSVSLQVSISGVGTFTQPTSSGIGNVSLQLLSICTGSFVLPIPDVTGTGYVSLSINTNASGSTLPTPPIEPSPPLPPPSKPVEAVTRGDGVDTVYSLTGSGYRCANPVTTHTNECSGDVFVNSIGVVRIGDLVGVHTKYNCSTDTSRLTTSSSTVFVNGLGIGRVNDKYTDDNTITSGSPTVFSG